jgi:toxin secretion/phage lysis holin
MEYLIKGAIAIIGTVISGMVGGLGLAFTVLVGMMLIDIVTGVMCGWAFNEVRSSVGVKGVTKKVYILILIGSVYLLQQVLPLAEFAGDGITIAFIIMEFISIIENGGKMGIKLPPQVENALSVLKGRVKE